MAKATGSRSAKGTAAHNSLIDRIARAGGAGHGGRTAASDLGFITRQVNAGVSTRTAINRLRKFNASR